MDQNCVWVSGAKFQTSDKKKAALIYMDINEMEIHAYVNSKEKNENKEYLSYLRDKLLEIFGKLNLKYKEFLHYSIDGKNGKIEYITVLDQFYEEPNSKIYLPETKQYIDPHELLKYTYTENVIRGDIKMNIENSNVSVIGNKNKDVEVNQGIRTEIETTINWVEKLPSEDAVTPTQLKEFQQTIEEFLKSDIVKKMTNEETEPLKEALKESKKPIQNKKEKWAKLKNFFLKSVTTIPTLVSKFAQFVEKTPAVVSWIKALIIK